MDDLHVAIEAARAGGAIVVKHFGAAPDPEYKSKFDPVTAVDRAAEAAVLSILEQHRPADDILAEESGGTVTGGRHWIVDPLDGTVNFIHGIAGQNGGGRAGDRLVSIIIVARISPAPPTIRVRR